MSRDSVLYRSLAYIDTNLCPPQAVLCICHIHIPISPSLSSLLLCVSFSLPVPSSSLPRALSRSLPPLFILLSLLLLLLLLAFSIILSLSLFLQASLSSSLYYPVSLCRSSVLARRSRCPSFSLSPSFFLCFLAFGLPPRCFPLTHSLTLSLSRFLSRARARGKFLACIHVQFERVPPRVPVRLSRNGEGERGTNWSAHNHAQHRGMCYVYINGTRGTDGRNVFVLFTAFIEREREI